MASRIPYNAHPTVSETVHQSVAGAQAAMPEILQEYFATRGWSIEALPLKGRTLEECYALAGQLEDYERRKQQDPSFAESPPLPTSRADAACSGGLKKIFIFEKNKVFDEVRPGAFAQGRGTNELKQQILIHEFGHAFDKEEDLLMDEHIIAAHEKDIAGLTDEERSRANYFVNPQSYREQHPDITEEQLRDKGRSETLAEMFSYMVRNGREPPPFDNSPSTDWFDIREKQHMQMFPHTAARLAQRLNQRGIAVSPNPDSANMVEEVENLVRRQQEPQVQPSPEPVPLGPEMPAPENGPEPELDRAALAAELEALSELEQEQEASPVIGEAPQTPER